MTQQKLIMGFGYLAAVIFLVASFCWLKVGSKLTESNTGSPNNSFFQRFTNFLTFALTLNSKYLPDSARGDWPSYRRYLVVSVSLMACVVIADVLMNGSDDTTLKIES